MAGDIGVQEQTINERALREPIPMPFFTSKAQTALKNKSASQPAVVQMGYVAMARMFRTCNPADSKPLAHSLHTIASFPTDPELCHLFNYMLTAAEREVSRVMYLEHQYTPVGTLLTGDSTSNEGMNITVKRNGHMMIRNTSRFDLPPGAKVYVIQPAATVCFDKAGKPRTAAQEFLTISSKLTAKKRTGIIEWAPMITIPEEQFAQFVEHRLLNSVSPADYNEAYQMLVAQCFIGEIERSPIAAGEMGSIMWKDP